jgi:uncharacterized phage protein (TIGR02218 family)
MTYAARETSRYSGLPYEIYLFSSVTENWRMTSGDIDRTYLGQIYSATAMNRTEIAQDQELSSGSIKVTVPRTCDLASRFVAYIPSTPVSLVIYRGHDGDSEVVVNFTGRIASVTFADECEIEVVPEQQVLRRQVPIQKFQAQCNWVLYGGGCGVAKIGFLTPGTVLTVSGAVVTIAAAGTKTNGWFNNGYLEKGEERRMILSHTGTSITLINFLANLVPGDSVNLYAGCQRNADDCTRRFNNLVNFWGFPWIPTKNPFGGGLL